MNVQGHPWSSLWSASVLLSQFLLEADCCDFRWSRWITPTTQPKRFDTTFFLHILPQSSINSENPFLKADGTETASAEWVRAADLF